MENLLTIEERISSALDSYTVIETLKTKESLSEEDVDTIQRNIDHLKIVLQDEEFLNSVTKKNLVKLNKHI